MSNGADSVRFLGASDSPLEEIIDKDSLDRKAQAKVDYSMGLGVLIRRSTPQERSDAVGLSVRKHALETP